MRLKVYPTHESFTSYTNAELGKYTHAWMHAHDEEVTQDAKITAGGKLLAYIIDAASLKVKDLLEFEAYEFLKDTEYANKSSITVFRKPIVDKDDYIICKCGRDTVYTGIYKDYSTSSKSSEYKITILQKEQLFDRFVFIKNEQLISTVGIEDFIAEIIKANWISSGDDMTDRKYMTVTALTHTPVYAKVSTTVTLTDGAFNLKTYLGNALEHYGIQVGMEIIENKLNVYIVKINDTAVGVNVNDSDISEYSEQYSADALTSLHVEWQQEAAEGDEIIATTQRAYYLLNDRSISTDKTDANRAKGSIRSKVVKTKTEEEMYQNVKDAFSQNSFSHKISFNLYMDSQIYNYLDFEIGKSCTIKTKDGIRTSLVTAVSINNKSRFAKIELGKLKVTLIEKIRSMAS